MLQKITDLWPTLLRQYQGLDEDGEEAQGEENDVDQEETVTIDEAFKNLRWTRVISLRDYKQMAPHVYSMADDIKYIKQKMAAIKLDGLPQL